MFRIAAVISIVWIEVLLAALAFAAARRGSALARVLWMDTLTLALMALLVLIGYARGDPAYLDGALGLGLLAFAGTLAATYFQRTERLL